MTATDRHAGKTALVTGGNRGIGTSANEPAAYRLIDTPLGELCRNSASTTASGSPRW